MFSLSLKFEQNLFSDSRDIAREKKNIIKLKACQRTERGQTDRLIIRKADTYIPVKHQT